MAGGGLLFLFLSFFFFFSLPHRVRGGFSAVSLTCHDGSIRRRFGGVAFSAFFASLCPECVAFNAFLVV